MSKNIVGAAAAIVVLAALAASSALSAGPKTARSAALLSGTWITTVTLVNPPPGVDSTFQALDTFVAGGGILVSSSQSRAPMRSLAHGNCTQAPGLRYSCTFVWFRFDATGAPVGTQRVRRTMTLSSDRSTFTANDTIDVLAPNGTVVASLQGTETGSKLGM